MLRFSLVDTNKLLIIVAALAGLVAGFLLANTINRNEMTTLRAENESLKSSGVNSGTQGPNANLTQEEIDATLARADQRPDEPVPWRELVGRAGA